jgi:type I restriction enzyme S subunit
VREDVEGAWANRMSIEQISSELAAQTVWPIDRIKDHTEKIGSGVTPSGGATSYLDVGIPLLRSQNVHFDGLRLDDVVYISEETHEEMRGTKLRERDVLLNITGASIGRCSFVPDGFGEGNVNQHVCIIRLTAKLNYKFLTYCLSAPWGQDQILSSFTGASRQGLGQRDLGEIRVPLPLLPEQERIVTYLDVSCAAIDAAVAAKRRQIETLRNLKHSNIYRAVTRGLDDCATFKESGLDWLREIPSHWSVRRIKDIAELRSGDAIQAEDIVPAGDYPVYGGNGLRGYTSSFTHDGHFVLIGRQGALCGNINYANGRFWATEHAVVVTTLRQCDTLWLGELLRVMNLNQYSNAAAQPGLAVERIKFLKVPIPPTEEQVAIAHGLKEIILTTEKIAVQMEQQIATLVVYRKSLIHECVTGQRRVTEADIKRVQLHG